MRDDLSVVFVLYNNNFNKQSFLILQNCLELICKSDQLSHEIMLCALRQEDYSTELASIYFGRVPNRYKDNYYLKQKNLSDMIIFRFVNNLVAVPKNIAADAVLNFCMRNANKPEKLRPLYEQIREKFNITYPHVV